MLCALDAGRRWWAWYAEMWRPPESRPWYTANRVILDRTDLRLLDFGGKGEPALFVPPQTGLDSNAVDYGPGQSLVASALEAGHHVYSMDWRPCTFGHRHDGIPEAIGCIRDCLTLTGPACLVGVCEGGWQAAIVAALWPELVRSLVIVAAPIDSKAAPGYMRRWLNILPRWWFRWVVGCGGGFMPGLWMRLAFMGMHPWRHYVQDPLDTLAHIDDEPWLVRRRRWLDWYHRDQDIPGTLCAEAAEMMRDNTLALGDLMLDGRRVDLQQIVCPTAIVAGREDDITPYADSLGMACLISGPTEAWLIPGGHMAVWTGRRAIAETWPAVWEWLQSGRRE